MNFGSPGRSTIADTSYSFEEKMPLNNQIFELKLFQLHQNLSTIERYNSAFLPNQITQNIHQYSSAPFQTQEAEVLVHNRTEEIDHRTVKTSEIHVPFEVSISFIFGSDIYFIETWNKKMAT